MGAKLRAAKSLCTRLSAIATLSTMVAAKTHAMLSDVNPSNHVPFVAPTAIPLKETRKGSTEASSITGNAAINFKRGSDGSTKNDSKGNSSDDLGATAIIVAEVLSVAAALFVGLVLASRIDCFHFNFLCHFR